MRQPLSESSIVRTVAEVAAKRITRKTIIGLQRMEDTLSGEDSELKTTWDEICVQVQDDKSVFWDAYDFTARSFVKPYVEKLSVHEREALWLQTEEGLEWSWSETNERDAYPVCYESIVDYVMREYIYVEAMEWNNRRIRAFLDRCHMRD